MDNRFQRCMLLFGAIALLTVLNFAFLRVMHIDFEALYHILHIQDISFWTPELTQKEFPKWERPPMFLDRVPAFRIINDTDPLSIMSLTSNSDRNPTLSNSRIQNITSPSGLRIKRILIVNNPYWDWTRRGEIGSGKCPLFCSITSNMSEFEIADAVIFYAVGLRTDPPKPRPRGQTWLFLTLESPINSNIKHFSRSVWNNQINWTLTYRSDSDIWEPYGRINRRNQPLNTNFTTLALRKTKRVAWFVSHCWTQSRRESLVSQLKHFLPVDVFGRCGTKQCEPTEGDECFQMLTNHYRFYLSFENSLCDDYITEKVFKIMWKSDVVPVVYGSANYTKYLPPHSFINVADFDNVGSLANYLNYLERNVSAYIEYFEWKKYYFASELINPLCEICMKLNDSERYQNTYKNVYSWYMDGTCYAPNISIQH